MYENVRKCLELLPVSYDLYRMARRALNDEEKAQLLWILKEGRKHFNAKNWWDLSDFIHALCNVYNDVQNVYWGKRLVPTSAEWFRNVTLKTIDEGFKAMQENKGEKLYEQPT